MITKHKLLLKYNNNNLNIIKYNNTLKLKYKMNENYKSKNPNKRSISLNDISKYSNISVTDFFEQIHCEDELMIYYLDYIRNYKYLMPEMLKKIHGFSQQNKMKLIIEFNKVLKDINDFFI